MADPGGFCSWSLREEGRTEGKRKEEVGGRAIFRISEDIFRITQP